MSRRALFRTTVAAIAGLGLTRPASVPARGAMPLELSGDAVSTTVDFEAAGVDGWTVIDGQWTVEEMPGAPSGKKVLVQRATRNPFDVLVAPPGPYTDVDVSVKFKPISGREDASGGIIFDCDGRYYVVRANALEDHSAYAYVGAAAARGALKPPALASGTACGWCGGRSHAVLAQRCAPTRPSRRSLHSCRIGCGQAYRSRPRYMFDPRMKYGNRTTTRTRPVVKAALVYQTVRRTACSG